MKHVKELKSVGVDLHIPGPSCLGVRASMAAIREIRAFMMADEEAALTTSAGPVVGSKETIEALRVLLMQPAKPKPQPISPFDLEAAKAGAPLVTRDGRKARFVAHVPEAKLYPYVVHVEGDDMVTVMMDAASRLFMAPKLKRTVWVNMVGSAPKKIGVMNAWHFDDVNAALAHAASYRESKYARDYPLIAVAVPIEIEA